MVGPWSAATPPGASRPPIGARGLLAAAAVNGREITRRCAKRPRPRRWVSLLVGVEMHARDRGRTASRGDCVTDGCRGAVQRNALLEIARARVDAGPHRLVSLDSARLRFVFYASVSQETSCGRAPGGARAKSRTRSLNRSGRPRVPSKVHALAQDMQDTRALVLDL